MQPVVTSIAPTYGSDLGGVAITITGVFPDAIDSARFGTLPGSSVVRVNGTTVTCLSPRGGAGVVSVTVRDVHGHEGTLEGAYGFEADAGPPSP